MKFLLFTFSIILFLLSDTAPNGAQDDSYIRADRLGITHISSATTDTPDSRYRQALALGAGWNRFPIYWNLVQPEEDAWDWSAYDHQIRRDLEFGLHINAILLGRPEFYADDNRIAGMNEPIFADGTDTPAPDKALNSENPWVNFVYEAVSRYRPGGALAQQSPLEGDGGITVWEIWNEPDHSPFWGGSIRDYARLLKMSYIVIKMVDPEAQVMFGGLLYPTENNWLAQVLKIYADDPFVERYNWYMDIVAVHAYADPWRSGWLTLYARETLDAYDLEKPIWLNEMGVPVWDDYPGPVWESTSLKRSTQQQQAWYIIQSAISAWAEGADKVFVHQLYDDCGDQPPGTDFPPNRGEICASGACFGDAHGMFRNLPNSVCFSQHPQPGTARPAAQAYKLLAEVFGTDAFDSGKREFLDESVVTYTFERPRTEERITVMWNRTFIPTTFDYEAIGENGQLISLSGSTVIAPNDEGMFQIGLPAAQRDNVPSPPPNHDAAIGGEPVILIEAPEGRVREMVVDLSIDVDAPTPEPLIPAMRPTVDPAEDDTPPRATVLPMPPRSEATFAVRWEGEDDSGIDRYLIWVRVDGGTWMPWLETTQTSADYTGTPGSTYEFAAWAVDLAGNWSDNADIKLQAGTQVQR